MVATTNNSTTTKATSQASELVAPVQNPFAQHGPLADLKDIHLPDPISLWPNTIGWYLVAIITFFVSITILRKLRKKWRKLAYKRDALQHLSQLEWQYMSNANQRQLLNELSDLMRRVCLSSFPRQQVAGLTGQKWLAFLDSEGNTNQFTAGCGAALVEQKFSTHLSYDSAELISICRLWINTRR